MKSWLRIWHKIRKTFLKLIGMIVIEKLIGMDEIAVEIDSEGVDFVSIDAYFVIVVFNNRTANSFPINKGNNLNAGYSLKQATLRNKDIP
jgi:hypothetical protein